MKFWLWWLLALFLSAWIILWGPSAFADVAFDQANYTALLQEIHDCRIDRDQSIPAMREIITSQAEEIEVQKAQIASCDTAIKECETKIVSVQKHYEDAVIKAAPSWWEDLWANTEEIILIVLAGGIGYLAGHGF